MRLYRQKYKDKNGKAKQCKTWSIEFRDPNGIVRVWSLGTADEKASKAVASQINSLNEWAKQALPPPMDLLRWANQQKPRLYDKMYSAGILGNHCDYKPVPKTGTPLRQLQDIDIPYGSGIYFVFSNNKVVYVGKTKSLVSRIKGGHKNLKKSDGIAWIKYPVRLLNFAESFYIGTCRPERNFGGQMI